MRKINLKRSFVVTVSVGCLALAGVQLVGAANNYDITAYCGDNSGTGTYIYYASNNEYYTYALKVDYEYMYSLVGVHEVDTETVSTLTHENNVRITATAKASRNVKESRKTTSSGYKDGVLVGSAMDTYD